jgi:hypothetical protein
MNKDLNDMSKEKLRYTKIQNFGQFGDSNAYKRKEAISYCNILRIESTSVLRKFNSNGYIVQD